MSPSIATARTVDRDELLEFVRSRHRGHARDHASRRTTAALAGDVRARRRGPHRGVDLSRPCEGDTTRASYPRVSIVVQSDDWNGEYVQVDGQAEVLDMPTRSTASSSTSGASRVSTRTGTSTVTRCDCRTSRSCASPSSAGDRSSTGGFPADVAARWTAQLRFGVANPRISRFCHAKWLSERARPRSRRGLPGRPRRRRRRSSARRRWTSAPIRGRRLGHEIGERDVAVETEREVVQPGRKRL